MRARTAAAAAAVAFQMAVSMGVRADPDPASSSAGANQVAAEILVLPGVANTLGTHGSRWRSDLAIRNPGNEPVEVRVFFLRAGAAHDLATAPHHDYFLLASESKDVRNILGADFSLSGTGALLVAASRSVFPNNPAGSVVTASLRTATPLPFGTGDAGSVIPAAEPTIAPRQVVTGLRHDGTGDKGLRASVGAVNLATQGITLRIEYLDDSGEVLTARDMHLGPLGTAQQTVPVRLAPGAVRFSRIDGAGPFVAYGTTVDNVSSESTFAYAGPEAGQTASPHRLTWTALSD